jgi:hypothetical protein
VHNTVSLPRDIIGNLSPASAGFSFQRTMMTTTGARYEIAIDGATRTYRDRKDMAIEAATHLKTKIRIAR